MLNKILNNITSSILLGDSSRILGDNINSSSNTTSTNFLNNLSELGLYGLHRNATSVGAGVGDDAIGSMGGGGTAAAANNDVPQIPDYIRYTSMVFCIAIMCLGVIGNIMVNI